MSDTLRAKETEDVLSSIRRLVSAEPRQALQHPEKALVLGQPRTEAGPALQIKPQEVGRLVLGPALRVSADAALNPLLLGQKPASPQAAPSLEPNLGPNVTAFPKAVELAALPKAAEAHDEQDLSFEAEEEVEDAPFIEILDEAPQSAEVTPFPRAHEPLVEHVQEEVAEEFEAEEIDPAYEDDALEADDLASEEAEFSDEQANALEDIAADEEEPRGHWSAQHLPDVGWIAEAGSEWDDEETQIFESYKRQASASEEPSLPPEWADAAEAEVRATLQEPRMESGELVAPVDHLNMFHAPSLDDGALRDIVRQLIREELSGSLGERITRNVRKLVRIEVNRALTNSTLE